MKLWLWLPTFIWILPFFATVGLLGVWIQLKDSSGKRNPLTKDLLRSPGEYLREQIADINLDIVLYLAFSPYPATYSYAVIVSSKAFEGVWPSGGLLLFYGVFAVGAQCWIFWKLWGLLKKRRFLTLGYEAELAVGQELNLQARFGFHIFHDVPAREFNIDHVIVGPTGVFAVETKGRAKRTQKGGWEVEYDDRGLAFAGAAPTDEPIVQASRQAKWLKDWLSSAIGESIAVQPVLVLPGWFIKRTSKPGVPVLGSKDLENYFKNCRVERELPAQVIERVRHQLDQRCRNVASRAYAKERKADHL